MLLNNSVALAVGLLIQVNNVYVLLFCRIVQGILTGCFMSIVPIYINEICPKQIVGVFGVFTQLFTALALVVNYGLGVVLTKMGAAPFTFFRVLVTYNSFLILLQSILLLADYVPESPNYLIKKNRNDQAREVVALFTREEFVETTVRHKRMEVSAEAERNELRLSERLSGVGQDKIVYSRRAYLLGFEIPFMMQMTGINGVMVSANSIVVRVAPQLSEYTGLTITSIRLVSTMFTLPILAHFGRKPLLLFGNLALGVIDILIAVSFLWDSQDLSGGIIFVLLIVYVIVFGVTLGPVTWLYVPEIVPARVVPLATMMTWLGSTISTILIPVVIEVNGGNPYPVFFLFGTVTLLFFVFNRRYVVETKGKTALHIAREFHSG